ncbi:hypothetical protein [Xanthobacter versatilis]|uniref:hypothetical protein n=1 Tax=Xanthobacter autotrophicus (strain ATCC BAA-1158 / Py2) TaxID=78245 RepID=UPI0037292D0F
MARIVLSSPGHLRRQADLLPRVRCEIPFGGFVEVNGATMVRAFTTKQMGDACEMLIAAELTLAGIPALKVPDNWPHYDVIAQPLGLPPQRISVKSRTFKVGAAYVEYNESDRFDWLAIVILINGGGERRSIYMIPRAEADKVARRDKPTSKTADLRYFRIDEVERLFARFRNNFALVTSPGAPQQVETMPNDGLQKELSSA